jgi:hypothetical protein
MIFCLRVLPSYSPPAPPPPAQKKTSQDGKKEPEKGEDWSSRTFEASLGRGEEGFAIRGLPAPPSPLATFLFSLFLPPLILLRFAFLTPHILLSFFLSGRGKRGGEHGKCESETLAFHPLHKKGQGRECLVCLTPSCHFSPHIIAS